MGAIRAGASSAVFVISTWVVVACNVAAALSTLAAGKLKTPR